MPDDAVSDVEFDSQGLTLRGRLYAAGTADKPGPGAVMCHGFSATIDGMVLKHYAGVLQAAGVTVLLYDHPCVGRSDGEPRRRISVWLQARGILDALTWLERQPSVRADRIALWGDSFSAGAAMLAAVCAPQVAALIAQVPSCGRDFPPPAADGDEAAADAAYAGAVRATLESDFRTTPFDEQAERPVVAADQVRGASWLEPLTAFRWFMEYGTRFDTGWVNGATRAEPRGAPPFLPVRCASQLRMPAFFVIAQNDEMPGSREDVARMAFERWAGPKELSIVDGGHFGLLYHPSTEFDQVSSAQADFLRRWLHG